MLPNWWSMRRGAAVTNKSEKTQGTTEMAVTGEQMLLAFYLDSNLCSGP